MPIRCVCPRGHVLKVSDEAAGTWGLCPVCRSRMKVPALRARKVSEDAVMEILGPPEPANIEDVFSTEEQEDPQTADPSRSGVSEREDAVKTRRCDRCRREISAATHICPHCHTYIARPTDF